MDPQCRSVPVEANGNEVTGTAGPEGAAFPITGGRIEGNHLTFSVGKSPEPVWNFDLTVSDKLLRGTGSGTKEGQSIGTTQVEMSLDNGH